jgi:hypothetical protein
MNCDIPYLRITDSPTWATTKTGYYKRKPSARRGRNERAKPDDFRQMWETLHNKKKIIKHYKAGLKTVDRWIAELKNV